MEYRKKLIEVALPLDAINTASAREKAIRRGHPSTFHLWWARRPLAACRAVLFASFVDDPSSWPQHFPTEEAQESERRRIFRIIEQLVEWESSSNQEVLGAARLEIARSLARARGEQPPTEPGQVSEYLQRNAPPVLDPFCGGGSIPLEAQRLGLKAHGRDLNPVAVLITKALVEIPPTFANRPPLNPAARARIGSSDGWKGAHGLAEDVRYYGKWLRDEAERRIGTLYPKVDSPKEHGGGQGTAIAWIWARTVTCPNPACRGELPLVNSFAISTRPGREVRMLPEHTPGEKRVRFRIERGRGSMPPGTVARTGARCLLCEASVPLQYVRSEGKAGRMGMQLLAVIGEGAAGRHYMPASPEQAAAAIVRAPDNAPDTTLPESALGFRVQGYGITRHADLFTNRQLHTLTTFSDLVAAAHARCLRDGAEQAYADAVATYLGLAVSRLANRCSTQCFWNPGRETVEQVFARNALPMVWVFAEANPFSDSSGNFLGQLEYLARALEGVPTGRQGTVQQGDAASGGWPAPVCVSTDPPYYDNVPYADLSDFFYVWLRRSLGSLHPDLFRTVLVPKADELIAEPARHGDWDEAATFFEDGLRRVFGHARAAQHPEYPCTIFYAFKQAEEGTRGVDGRASTGWETLLQGLVDSALQITGTWPIRTEQTGGLREFGRNALASSIVMVCRPRPKEAPVATRGEFVNRLKGELPLAVRHLQRGNIAPVDLAQAAIGPAMAVFTRWSKVLDAAGDPLSVRDALALINQVLDEVLAEQEAEFDADTRWALAWFEQHGFSDGRFGVAETLSKAKNTAVDGLVEAGIVTSRAGKVRLRKPAELPQDWDPVTDRRLTVWEMVHHLVRVLQAEGETGAAKLVARLGRKVEVARELAYRLYAICERKKRAEEALSYNGLVQSWPEIVRLAQAEGVPAQGAAQAGLFEEE